jgi:hypothetical protein
MRSLVLLSTFFVLQGAYALPGASKEAEPQPPKFTKLIDHMTNPDLENLVSLADEVTALPELGDCPRFVYRVKMTLPSEIKYDAALNEFMSLITPGARTFAFGLLSSTEPASNSILKMAQVEPSDKSEGELAQLDALTDAALECNTNTVLMEGTAVYSGANLPDASMTVRAVVDSNAGEFLIFGAGKCQ